MIGFHAGVMPGSETSALALRGRSALLIALPLAVAGSLIAHQLAYAIVGGAGAAQLLAASGHGYLDRLPAGGALGLAVLVVGLLLAIGDRGPSGRGRPLPAWAIATAPVAVFAVQEHLERWAHTGGFPWQAALEPTFAVGIALQVPFALAAWLLARLLVRAVTALVAEEAPRRRHGRPRARLAPVAPSPRPRAGLARRIAPRGPPAMSSA